MVDSSHVLEQKVVSYRIAYGAFVDKTLQSIVQLCGDQQLCNIVRGFPLQYYCVIWWRSEKP